MNLHNFILTIGIVCICSLFSILSTFSIVEEGHHAIVKRFGVVQPHVLPPGIHFVFPLIDSVYQVQTTTQTDKISGVVCGTSSGVTVTFDNIHVVNKLHPYSVVNVVKGYGLDYDKPLIFDKIAHEMNQFCSENTFHEVYIKYFSKIDDILMESLIKSLKHIDGLEIIAVRISKPAIPSDVQQRYQELVASQARQLANNATGYEELMKIDIDNMKKLKQLDAINQQDLMDIDFKKQKQIAEIESKIAVDLKTLEQQKVLAEGESVIQEIKSQTDFKIKKIQADADYYTGSKQAEVQILMQTEIMRDIEVSKSLFANSKTYVVIPGFDEGGLLGKLGKYISNKIPNK